MFLLLMSAKFYRCIEKGIANKFCYISRFFGEIWLKSCRKIGGDIFCRLNFLMRFKIWGFSWYFLYSMYYILLPAYYIAYLFTFYSY